MGWWLVIGAVTPSYFKIVSVYSNCLEAMLLIQITCLPYQYKAASFHSLVTISSLHAFNPHPCLVP
jgi:hypothetical protein